MATLHISEEEAARNFPTLLEKVRAGAEVVIDNAALSAVVVRLADAPSTRRLSESLKMAKDRSSPALLDGDFAADLQRVVDSHREPLHDFWD